ncbi:MAG: tRNA (adenosine(37)-N6)-threonylcarbamoyltransferase complex ATPase subunit type 1 TsaE [Gammaproteobacteria bacterium]|nr:tRNA (adenosine(37)-N6)-threonylcarbamoyltransferase complex ATPase subunit type 1 TsaE [Gammaproteobacteria bacterium]
METVQTLVDEQATLNFGGRLALQLIEKFGGNAVVFLHGDLGAGKTTLVRGLLHQLGYSGVVKSPTYTLLEPYHIERSRISVQSTETQDVYHFDLYRVNDPQELEFVGFDELVDGPGLKLFEWPQRADSWLPTPDVNVSLNAIQIGDHIAREVHVSFT